ncbi:MAG TPA: RuvA C-terminal domain-containing protein, partial [Polyangiaceae bacterium]|nr:RuvA C-terminal domain-containing protein [Polyangiaceae bacterium]
TGTASSARFAHADGAPYGGVVGPAAADARAKAFQALRGLGFREGDAKCALAKIPNTFCSIEQVIRQALSKLAPQ